jgi:hypothetical protein
MTIGYSSEIRYKTANAPETISLQFASNQGIISCFFFQLRVCFGIVFLCLLPANPCLVEQRVVTLIGVKNYFIICFN